MTKWYEGYFNGRYVSALSIDYHALYPMMNTSAPIPRKHLVCTDIEVHGERLLSMKSKSQCSSDIMAYWYASNGEMSVHSIPHRFGIVHYLIRHSIMITTLIAEHNSKNGEHLFARVSWYGQHPRQDFLSLSSSCGYNSM